MSPDRPFADQHTSNPQSWNLYEYGRNNPLRNVDLNGFKVLQAVLAEAVSKINTLPGGTLYLDFAGIQGLHGHPSLNASNNFDGWHSDHSSANSVIIPNNGIVSGFFRALFGLANKDQADTGKAIVAAAKSSGQDVAFDTYSNGVNAAGQVAQGMSAGDLQSATVVGPNANSPAPVQAMDQADGDSTQIYISINDPALALALFGSQSTDDWTSELVTGFMSQISLHTISINIEALREKRRGQDFVQQNLQVAIKTIVPLEGSKMRFVGIFWWFLMAVVLSAQPDVMTQDLKVLVLDALDGKPQANVKVESLCVGSPSNSWGKSTLTNDMGIATISYACNDKQKVEISVYPPNKKEQCGDDVNTNLNDVTSMGFISNPSSDGGIWCPTKVSRTLKPLPGQVIMFVKKPTWWQSHVAG